MTSYPPSGGDPQRGPDDEGQPSPPAPDGSGAWVDPADPLVATSLSGWVSKVVGVVARSWQPLLLLQLAILPFAALFYPVGLVVRATGAPLLGVLLGLLLLIVVVIVGLILQGASVHYVTVDAGGTRASLGEALRFGRSRAGILFGWGVVVGLMIIAGPVIGFVVAAAVGFTTGGLVAVVVLSLPALYLYVVSYAALLGAVMFERDGIGRAFSLVHRRFLPTVGRMLLTGVVGLVWYGLITLLVDSTLGSDSLTGVVVSQVLLIPLALVTIGVQIVTYAELRAWEAPGQVTTQRLVAELRP